jgi:hypothetical protein
MNKFPINNYSKFSEVPLSILEELKFSIYLLDFDWNYLFVNQFVKMNLGERGENLIGQNMWKTFPELTSDTAFAQLKKNMENGIVTLLETASPINSQRLKITGYRLEDCYYFTATILPSKIDLIKELRHELYKSMTRTKAKDAR